MKNILLPLLGTFLFILLVGILVTNPQKIFKNNKNINKQETQETNILKINEKDISVILANTNLLRKNGLSGYKSLDEDQGMLFVFEEKDQTPTFWMKDMLIPIDIIWIENEKIIDIDKNVQTEPNVKDSDLKRYYPDSPVDFVLEVNAGYSDKYDFSEGDLVDFSKINLE